MNKEIKELIFLLHNDRLTDSGKRKLEDYITNLEQENKKLKRENEKLKEEIKRQSKAQVILDNENNKLYDYKTRIDKAIEHLDLKQTRFINEKDYILDDLDLDEIMCILEGKSDE